MSSTCPKIWYMAQGYSVAGGHEAHILHYATALRDHGFSTEVVVANCLPREDHRFLWALRRRQISIASIEAACTARVYAGVLVSAGPWWLANRCRGLRTPLSSYRRYLVTKKVAEALRRKIDAERPDLIHIFGRLADNLWRVLPADRVVFHHGTEGIRDETWTHDEAEHFRAFCEDAAVNFAPGAGVAANVRKHFGIQRSIETVFTICPDEFRRTEVGGRRTEAGGQRTEIRDRRSEVRSQKSDKLTFDLGPLTSEFRTGARLMFGILCRFIPEKGIEDILAALEIFVEKHGAVNFTFAGQGPMESGIREEIERLESSNDGDPKKSAVCSLPSPVSPCIRIERVTSPVETLRDMDVFVHPSRSDAMPMAIAEALMCGRPCIASRVGGIPDLVRDGEEGFLVDAGHPEQIVATMERFYEMSDAEFAAFRVRARQRYEDVCKPEKVAAIVAGHYRDILRANETGDWRPETRARH